MIVKTVGRSSENNIVIDDASVSRVHLQLVYDEQGNTLVVDLGSANGTFVNGKRINSETRLNTGDELRLGNTVLNWQEYFPQPTIVPPDSHKPSHKPAKGDGKRGKPWLPIVIGVLVLLIAGASILFINRQNKIENEQQKQQQEEAEYRKLEREALTADRDAARAAAEYEEAMKKAAISKSEKDQRRADSLRTVYNKALQESNRLKTDLSEKEAALKKAEKEKNAAIKAKDDAEKAKDDAVKAKNDADKAKDAAVKAKDNAEKEKAEAERNEQNARTLKDQAEQRLKDAEDKAKLKDELYKELNNASKDDRLKEVCEALNIGTFLKNDDAKYNAIVKEFDKAPDNNKREEIINKIKSAKKSKKKNSDKTESDTASKSDNKL